MIKVLYLPLNTPEIIQTGMYDAWNNTGVELHVFDFYQKYIDKISVDVIRKEFLSKISQIKPNLVHMQLQFTSTIDPATILEAKKISPKSIFTNWTGDIRTNVPGEFVEMSQAVDYSLISSIGQIELYQSAGCKNVKYWQIGYNPKLYFPKNLNNFKYDISFAGAYYGDLFPGSKIRLEAIKRIQNEFGNKFGLFGNGFPNDIKSSGQVPQSSLNDIYAESLCVLSINNFNDTSHYFSDRLLMCMASGRPTISYRFPGITSYFSNNCDIVIVDEVEEIIKAVYEFKNNLNKANNIGLYGYKKVSAEHTYTSRAFELLDMLKIK